MSKSKELHQISTKQTIYAKRDKYKYLRIIVMEREGTAVTVNQKVAC